MSVVLNPSDLYISLTQEAFKTYQVLGSITRTFTYFVSDDILAQIKCVKASKVILICNQGWESLLYILILLYYENLWNFITGVFSTLNRRVYLIHLWIPMPVKFDLWNACMLSILWNTPEDPQFKRTSSFTHGYHKLLWKYRTRTNLRHCNCDLIRL